MTLDDLERVAKAAMPGKREVSIDGRKLIVWGTGDKHQGYERLAYLEELPDEHGDLAFILTCSPDVVLQLIAVAKAAKAVSERRKQLEQRAIIGQTMREHGIVHPEEDALRDALDALERL